MKVAKNCVLPPKKTAEAIAIMHSNGKCILTVDAKQKADHCSDMSWWIRFGRVQLKLDVGECWWGVGACLCPAEMEGSTWALRGMQPALLETLGRGGRCTFTRLRELKADPKLQARHLSEDI